MLTDLMQNDDLFESIKETISASFDPMTLNDRGENDVIFICLNYLKIKPSKILLKSFELVIFINIIQLFSFSVNSAKIEGYAFRLDLFFRDDVTRTGDDSTFESKYGLNGVDLRVICSVHGDHVDLNYMHDLTGQSNNHWCIHAMTVQKCVLRCLTDEACQSVYSQVETVDISEEFDGSVILPTYLCVHFGKKVSDFSNYESDLKNVDCSSCDGCSHGNPDGIAACHVREYLASNPDDIAPLRPLTDAVVVFMEHLGSDIDIFLESKKTYRYLTINKTHILKYGFIIVVIFY